MVRRLVAPRFLVRSSDFMWRRGGIFMETMRQQGGSGRLRYIYKHPPESTEQILHPEKYIAGETPSKLDVWPLEDLIATRKSASIFGTTPHVEMVMRRGLMPKASGSMSVRADSSVAS